MNRLLKAFVLSALFLGASRNSKADIIVRGADGSDGAFAPTGNVTIDLSQAISRAWDEPSPVAGRGVYDYEKWAVVFKYQSVNIPAGVTVTFKNHPSRAPVVWLVAGDVTIRGTVNIDGSPENGSNYALSEPGPGGFRGGRATVAGNLGSAGLGPGGGGFIPVSPPYAYGNGAGYAQPGGYDSSPGRPYGNPAILPLIGGSGGSGIQGIGGYGGGQGGGAGGGAILIAANGKVTVNGTISAKGGGAVGSCHWFYAGGGGSGGAIRLLANQIVTLQGSTLSAQGGADCKGDGSVGRIRIEGNGSTLGGTIVPVPSQAQVDAPPVLWATDLADAPSVRIVSVGPASVRMDPWASLDFPGADATIPDGGDQVAVIEALNVPLDWAVQLRMVPTQGTETRASAAFVSGSEVQSTWQATVPFSSGFSALQVRAYNPATAAAANADGLGTNALESGQE